MATKMVKRFIERSRPGNETFIKKRNYRGCIGFE